MVARAKREHASARVATARWRVTRSKQVTTEGRRRRMCMGWRTLSNSLWQYQASSFDTIPARIEQTIAMLWQTIAWRVGCHRQPCVCTARFRAGRVR